jgi:AraC-like DNA-binding protein
MAFGAASNQHMALANMPVSAIPVEELAQKIQSVCGNFSVEPERQHKGYVKGDVKTMTLARFDTAIVSLNANNVSRTRSHIKADPGSHLFLLIQDEGRCTIRQNDCITQLNTGDMFLVDSSRSSEFIYDGNSSRQISIHLPRKEMMHRFGAICTDGHAISSDDPLFLAMRAVLTKIFQSTTSATPQLNDALLSLLGSYFRCLELQSSDATRHQNALLSNALTLIDRYALDPAFGPTELAEKLGVNMRALQRQFSLIDETPSKRILNARLNAAHTRLMAEGQTSDKITTIAYDCGFNDLSYFYRAFKEKFGTPPGEIKLRVAMIQKD